MRVQFSNWTFYNGRDLKGYLLDFSLVDIGFCRVYPEDSPALTIFYFCCFYISDTILIYLPLRIVRKKVKTSRQMFHYYLSLKSFKKSIMNWLR